MRQAASRFFLQGIFDFYSYSLPSANCLNMTKSRIRTKTGKNRQRWKKGQSSSSNPIKTKYREAAKAKLHRVGFGALDNQIPKGLNNGPTRLTAETLLKHDALMGNISVNDTNNGEDNDAITLGQTNKTFDTFASSVWSDCSNIRYDFT